MKSVDHAMALLVAADPARGTTLDRDEVERALAGVLTSISRDCQRGGVGGKEGAFARPKGSVARQRGAFAGRSVGRVPVRVLVLAVLAALVLAAVALAATGAFRAGAPVRRSDPLIGHSGQDLGDVVRTELLSLSTPDPYGGPPWGMRVVYTSRGVGCLEVGRLLEGRLGALGIDGAFKDDRRFHELRPGRLSGLSECADLDGSGRLLYTAAKRGLPRSVSEGCLPTPTPDEGYGRLPPGGICPADGVRQVYFGTLGPLARGVIYREGGQPHRLAIRPPAGAYLIVLPSPPSFLRHDGFGTGTIGSRLPSPWTSPVTAVLYQDGAVCHIGALGPGVLREHCPLRGYTPVPGPRPTHAEVASPLHFAVSHDDQGHREIAVSFIARASVTSAKQAYEVVGSTSSPSAGLQVTKHNIKAGERVSFSLWAPAPGTYSGKVIYTYSQKSDFPVEDFTPGPLVANYRITLHSGRYPCPLHVECSKRRGR
jgi:hypothetical protein